VPGWAYIALGGTIAVVAFFVRRDLRRKRRALHGILALEFTITAQKPFSARGPWRGFDAYLERRRHRNDGWWTRVQLVRSEVAPDDDASVTVVRCLKWDTSLAGDEPDGTRAVLEGADYVVYGASSERWAPYVDRFLQIEAAGVVFDELFVAADRVSFLLPGNYDRIPKEALTLTLNLGADLLESGPAPV
jgi:hypothetical protein